MANGFSRSPDRALVLARAWCVAPAGVCAVAVTATVISCSGGDLVLPQPAVGFRLAVVSGNEQTGTVGEPLPKPLVVELRDAQGIPMVKRRVAFVVTGGPAVAQLAPDTAVTDGDGQAVGRWTLGKVPGDYTAEARLIASPDDSIHVELPVTELSAAARPGDPDTLRATSKENQAAQAGKAVAVPPTVRVADRFGNPVPGVAVHWTVASDGGSVSAASVVTGDDGLATVVWTVADRVGFNQLSATVDGHVVGSPVVFTAFVFF